MVVRKRAGRTGQEKLKEKFKEEQELADNETTGGGPPVDIDDSFEDLRDLGSAVEEEVRGEQEVPAVFGGATTNTNADGDVSGSSGVITFAVMLEAFAVFLKEHRVASSLKLSMKKINAHGEVLVYKGAPSSPWAYLRHRRCNFIHKSLLRSLLNLEEGRIPEPHCAVLQEYFAGYELSSGRVKK